MQYSSLVLSTFFSLVIYQLLNMEQEVNISYGSNYAYRYVQ